MNAAGTGASMSTLKRRALSLGAVKVFDHAMQFVLPVVLVRCLDSATFGEYRLLWLAVGTVMAVATLNMVGQLYYTVPRSQPRAQRLHVNQTLIFLIVVGVLWALAFSHWNPALPAALEPLAEHGWLVPAFVALWVVTFLLDHLPSVDERFKWQAGVILGTSALRIVLVALAAWFTGEMGAMLWALLAVVLLKAAVLVYYIARRYGLGEPWFERAAFMEQFRHGAPIGIGSALNGLRGKSDQWVAASLFAVSSFAAFSIAALVSHLMQVLRQSVMQTFLPSMSRLHAKGDVRAMLDMNSRGNVMVAKLLFPLLAFAFVFAPEMVTLVYTAAYVEAVPAIRVYIIGMLPMAIETASMVLLLRRGGFMLRVTAFTLAVSVGLSWTAALYLGLAGAAAGSVTTVYLDRWLVLRHLSRHTAIALAQLQDWRTLFVALGFAGATAALAWVLVGRLLPDAGLVTRLAAGAAVFALAYAAACLRQAFSHRNRKDAT
jgi:O-antigen/teichoic acid export membrane protein